MLIVAVERNHYTIFATTSKPTAMKHVMNWGGLLGLALIAFSLGLYLLDMNESNPAQWVSYIIIAAFIFLGTKSKRQSLGGNISYGQGLGTGVGVAFFGSVMVAFYTYVFFHFIDPNLLEELITRAEDKLYDQGMADDQIEIAMTWTRKFMQPGIMAAMVVLTYTFIGLVASLIIAAILKNEGDPFSSAIDSDVN